jgi:hypothetical protein
MQASRPRECLQTDCRPALRCLLAAMRLMVRWRALRPDCQTSSVLCLTMCWPRPRTVVWRQVRLMSMHRQRQAAGLQDFRRATWWAAKCGCAVLVVLKTTIAFTKLWS